jgi:hypothetical protein
MRADFRYSITRPIDPNPQKGTVFHVCFSAHIGPTELLRDALATVDE